MKNYFVFLTALFTLMSASNLIGQDAGVGEWKDYLPYSRSTEIVVTPTKGYCATAFSVYTYDREDNSIERLNKINGLSDIGVSALAYHQPTNTVIIGYENGNMDLVTENEIINFADIKRSSILGNKIINNVFFVDNIAFLATGFGIVELDMERREVKDDYVIGANESQIGINDLATDGNFMYAATDAGVYWAPYDLNTISDFNTWSKISGIPFTPEDFVEIDFFDGKIYAIHQGTAFADDSMVVYDGNSWSVFSLFNGGKDIHSFEAYGNEVLVAHQDHVSTYDANWVEQAKVFTYGTDRAPNPRGAVRDESGAVWIADHSQGMSKNIGSNNSTVINLGGPLNTNAVDVAVSEGNLFIAAGGKSNGWANTWNNDGMYFSLGGKWGTITKWNNSLLEDKNVHDIISVVIDPKDENHGFAAALGYGIIEFQDGVVTALYDNTNSTLPLKDESDSTSTNVPTTDMAFDADGNLWITSTGVNKALSVMTTTGTWVTFDLSNTLNGNIVDRLIVTQSDQKWAVLPKGGGLLVFDNNGTIRNTSDDDVTILTSSAGNGNLPTNVVHCIEEDHDGEIWVGTDLGIAVFFAPQNVFSGENFDAQQIFIQEDGQTKILLETEAVNDIAVDGANRKWIGTDKAGVFLMSEDGTERILNFTAENSPLLSNRILDIEINPDNGEVFFATEGGLISYRGTATEGSFNCDDVYAFPNPVSENYDGPIAIRGLIQNSVVKITDIGGNLIYETLAEGGQAIWDGNSLNGERAKSGVYMVFSADSQGTNSCVSKILFIN